MKNCIQNYNQGEIALEHLEGSCGISFGTIVEIGGMSTAVLLVVNASTDGLGPVEDLDLSRYVSYTRRSLEILGRRKDDALIAFKNF